MDIEQEIEVYLQSFPKDIRENLFIYTMLKDAFTQGWKLCVEELEKGEVNAGQVEH